MPRPPQMTLGQLRKLLAKVSDDAVVNVMWLPDGSEVPMSIAAHEVKLKTSPAILRLYEKDLGRPVPAIVVISSAHVEPEIEPHTGHVLY